jgi:hypothetical protein
VGLQILGFQECGEHRWAPRSSTRDRDREEGRCQTDQENGRALWGDGEPNAYSKGEYSLGVVPDHCGYAELLLRNCGSCPSAVEISVFARLKWSVETFGSCLHGTSTA